MHLVETWLTANWRTLYFQAMLDNIAVVVAMVVMVLLAIVIVSFKVVRRMVGGLLARY